MFYIHDLIFISAPPPHGFCHNGSRQRNKEQTWGEGPPFKSQWCCWTREVPCGRLGSSGQSESDYCFPPQWPPFSPPSCAALPATAREAEALHRPPRGTLLRDGRKPGQEAEGPGVLLALWQGQACCHGQSLLMISRFLAVRAEPLRHRDLKEIVLKDSDICYLLPFLLHPLPFWLQITTKINPEWLKL